MDTVAIMTTIIAVGSIIINILLLRANQKMYTEYFKDRSMGNRQAPKTETVHEQPE